MRERERERERERAASQHFAPRQARFIHFHSFIFSFIHPPPHGVLRRLLAEPSLPLADNNPRVRRAADRSWRSPRGPSGGRGKAAADGPGAASIAAKALLLPRPGHAPLFRASLLGAVRPARALPVLLFFEAGRRLGASWARWGPQGPPPVRGAAPSRPQPGALGAAVRGLDGGRQVPGGPDGTGPGGRGEAVMGAGGGPSDVLPPIEGSGGAVRPVHAQGRAGHPR